MDLFLLTLFLFFLDSLQYFWDKLTGPKILNLVPDAEHSLATGIVDVATCK